MRVATERLLADLFRLQFNDGVSAVPILRSLVHAAVLLLDVGRHLDDFEHAGQIARCVEIDDADAAGRYVRERLGISLSVKRATVASKSLAPIAQ